MQKDLFLPKTPVMEIQMLGGFSITVGDIVVSDTEARTKQVWHLLKFLIASRNKVVSQEEIIKVMWQGKNIKNPTNALKNLVYRIRIVFKEKEIPFYKDIIEYSRGSYKWNNNIPCIVDVEEFEKHCKKASDMSLSDDERRDEYRTAIKYYKGDFLSTSSDIPWIIPISSYLRTLFFKSVYSKLELLERKDTRDAYEHIEILCKETLIRGHLEEEVHVYLMRALHKMGRQKEAIEHYRKVGDQFYNELGIGPSERMEETYNYIVKTVQTIEPDIKIIQRDLRESSRIKGAFYCEYEVFKNFYRLEARTAARTGVSMFIGLLTVEDLESEKKDNKKRTMEALHHSIQSCLRKGDIYSRFSQTQFVLLLPTVTYENCELALNRVMRNYEDTSIGNVFKVKAKILLLEPID